ncbi:MAG: IMP dehydrogenase, partial [bacterium]|nr:IMP dehydrogenase [bacterium]
MANAHLDEFMNHFAHTALTYDDVTLVTQYADFLPADTSLHTRLTRNIELSVPFCSAAMDTVTEAEMAIAMALQGGIGIIHKNLEPAVQRTHVKRVKFYLNGFLDKARTMTADHTVGEVQRIKAERNWSFSSFPILDGQRRLEGIITSRELKYCDSPDRRLGEIMIRNPVTAPQGTTIQQAYDLMRRNKISILPILAEGGEFLGMY